MKKLLRKAFSEEMLLKLVPEFTLEFIRQYLRVESEGLENIPASGPGIIIANHSGFAGYDVLMLLNEIRRGRQRSARTVAHKLWFFGKHVQRFSEFMGFVEADFNQCLDILYQRDLMLIFPEGEKGNFKPSTRRYRLQEFRGGFVRMAMITGAPIIPAIVIGAEETHINLSQLKFPKALIGSVVPVPLNVIPLPIKWKIRFLPPIHLQNCSADDATDRKKVYDITRDIRHQLQRALVEELRRRKIGALRPVPVFDEDVPGL